MNIAAILAGGTGTRAGAGVPKQFLNMFGKTLLERTVDIFERHPRIDQVIVVAHPDHLAQTEGLRMRGKYRKWTQSVPGGKERYLSTVAAVNACPAEGNILIHDAARPFVSPALIDSLLDALETFPAAAPAIPLSDTLIEVENDFVKCTPDRNKFRLVQTPQAFRLPLIRKAAEAVIREANICITDDCGLFLHYFPNEKIKIVEGQKSNQKLTYKSDIELFRKIFLENS